MFEIRASLHYTCTMKKITSKLSTKTKLLVAIIATFVVLSVSTLAVTLSVNRNNPETSDPASVNAESSNVKYDAKQDEDLKKNKQNDKSDKPEKNNGGDAPDKKQAFTKENPVQQTNTAKKPRGKSNKNKPSKPKAADYNLNDGWYIVEHSMGGVVNTCYPKPFPAKEEDEPKCTGRYMEFREIGVAKSGSEATKIAINKIDKKLKKNNIEPKLGSMSKPLKLTSALCKKHNLSCSQ